MIIFPGRSGRAGASGFPFQGIRRVGHFRSQAYNLQVTNAWIMHATDCLSK